jgi:hypothetical protein
VRHAGAVWTVAGLLAVGFTAISITSTHEAEPGHAMAIIQAIKPAAQHT